MARITVSGAPSRRSDRLTWICPSRSRIVVFSEVNRRNRTVIGGIGALGRRALYSCSKIRTKSTLTKMENSRKAGTEGPRGRGSPYWPVALAARSSTIKKGQSGRTTLRVALRSSAFSLLHYFTSSFFNRLPSTVYLVPRLVILESSLKKATLRGLSIFQSTGML